MDLQEANKKSVTAQHLHGFKSLVSPQPEGGIESTAGHCRGNPEILTQSGNHFGLSTSLSFCMLTHTDYINVNKQKWPLPCTLWPLNCVRCLIYSCLLFSMRLFSTSIFQQMNFHIFDF